MLRFVQSLPQSGEKQKLSNDKNITSFITTICGLFKYLCRFACVYLWTILTLKLSIEGIHFLS